MGKLTGRLPRAGSRGQTHMGRVSRYALMDMLSRGCLSGMFCRHAHEQALIGRLSQAALTCMLSQACSHGHALRQGLAGRLSQTGSRVGSLTTMLTDRFLTVCSRAGSRADSGSQASSQADMLTRRDSRTGCRGNAHRQGLTGRVRDRLSLRQDQTTVLTGRATRRCSRAGSQTGGLTRTEPRTRSL
jgi:hypothetical protein